jgi:hypothetical protein
MPKPRSGTSYRLSEDAQDLLARLVDRFGLTKTGVVEMAIRNLADGTTADLNLSEADLRRRLCHSLIDHLNDQGLAEAVESLAEMVRFYENPPPACRVLPQGVPINAAWGETRVRPVYPVTEED